MQTSYLNYDNKKDDDDYYCNDDNDHFLTNSLLCRHFLDVMQRSLRVA